MHKLVLLPLLLMIGLFSMAQTRTVKGKLLDSATNAPIEQATVAILDVKDTTSILVGYTLTDKTGAFALHNLPAGTPLKILISFASYNSFRKNFTLAKTQSIDLGTVMLSSKQLHEVVIKGERAPVVIRADTIEFAAEAFKTRPNALVEDLLKKLPGVEVDNQGFVSVNGKAVSKILVDGHEFFSNDTRIATKNLDADMIDKVQVYDDRENDPNHVAPETDVNKIINLKFKKAYKKSIFGKFFAGAGTESRYETGGLINMFRDTLQVSILGAGNNLNNTGFSFNDLYTSGGLNRGGSNAINGAFGGSNSGIQKIVSGGVNINNDYGKKLKINLAYYYSHISNTYNSQSNAQRLLNDTDLITNNQSSRLRYDTRHTISSLIRWQSDKSAILSYTPSFSFSTNSAGSNNTGKTFSNFVPLINQSSITDNNTGGNASFQHSLLYNFPFKKNGESLNITHQLQISSANTDDYNINNLTSYTALVPSYNLNRYGNGVNYTSSGNINVTYGYSFSKKFNARIGVSEDYRHQVNNTAAFDLDTLNGRYDSFVQTLSSALTRNTWAEGVNPSFTYNISRKVSLAGGANAQVWQVNNQFDRGYADIDQHFFDVLPSISLTVGKFGASYGTSFNIPNIGDMIPYTIVSSPLSSVTGNPNLKPSKRDNYGLRYSSFLTEHQVTVSANANFSYERNGIFRQRTLNDAGAETSMPINMTGRYNYSLNGFVNKRIKKQNELTFSETTNLSASKSHSFFELNHQDGYQDTYSIAFNQSFSVNWKDIIDFNENYRLGNSITNYTGINYANVHNLTHVSDSHFIFYWTKSTSIEGNYTYTYNPVVSPGFQKSTNLLNLNIAHTLLAKDRGQIKFTCYDILNQNIGSTRFISENNITDTQSEILKRYFLITLQYKFNKALTKK